MSYEQLKNEGLKRRLSFLLKDSAVYGLAGAISQFLRIFTVPFITRAYSVEDFGASDVINTFSQVVIPFAFLGLDSAIARFYYEEKDATRKSNLVFSCFSTGFVASWVLTFVLLLFTEFFTNQVLQVKGFDIHYQVMILTLPFLYINQFVSNLFKWSFRRKAYLLMTLGSSALTILLTFISVVVLKQPILYTFIAHLIARVLFSFIGLWYCRKDIGRHWDIEQFKPVIAFGLPFMLTTFFGMLIPSMDRYVITQYLGLEAMGLYAFGQRLTSILHLPNKSFQTAWGPFSLSLYKDQNIGETYNKVLLFSTLFLCLCNILLVGIEHPLIHLMGSDKYADSRAIVPILGFSVVISAIIGVTSIGISLAKKSSYYLIGYLSSIVVSYVLMRLLSVYFGAVGVAFGLIMGQLFNMLMLFMLSQKLHPLPFRLLPPLSILGISLGLSLLTNLFYDFGFIVQLSVAIFLAAALLVGVFYLGLSNYEQMQIRKIIVDTKNRVF